MNHGIAPSQSLTGPFTNLITNPIKHVLSPTIINDLGCQVGFCYRECPMARIDGS